MSSDTFVGGGLIVTGDDGEPIVSGGQIADWIYIGGAQLPVDTFGRLVVSVIEGEGQSITTEAPFAREDMLPGGVHTPSEAIQHLADNIQYLSETVKQSTQRIVLPGRLNFRRAVITLCDLSDKASFSIGTLVFIRMNGTGGIAKTDIIFTPIYGTPDKVRACFLTFGGEQSGGYMDVNVHGMRACTFIHQGKKYGGLEHYFQDASYFVEFQGITSGFKMDQIEYLDTSGPTVINQEIHDSLNFTTDVVLFGRLSLNGTTIS